MAKILDSLQTALLHDTVLEEWFRPMQKALDAIRYSRNQFSTQTAEFFILLGCLRQFCDNKFEFIAHLKFLFNNQSDQIQEYL